MILYIGVGKYFHFYVIPFPFLPNKKRGGMNNRPANYAFFTA